MNAEERRSEDDPQPATGAPKEDAPASEALDAKKKPPFVFRFLPADPKNSLEFEDRADK